MARKCSPSHNLGIVNPALASEWHPTKNGHVTPFDVFPSSGKKFWWKCDHGHEWTNSVNGRAKINKNTGCPFCAGLYPTGLQNLKILFPEIAKQWHPTKNGDLKPDGFLPVSSKRVWWWCGRHEWSVTIGNRTTQNSECPFCIGRLASPEHNLLVCNPEIAKQWHPTKNGDLTPDRITPSSSLGIWWLCEKGHESKTSPANRTFGYRCPSCFGNKVTQEKNLAVMYPEIAKQWHPTKNGDLTPDRITPSSSLGIWWLCEKGHTWRAVSYSRVAGNGCGVCSNSFTEPEKKMEKILGLKKFDKCPLLLSGTRYRPDFRITDSLYLNTDGLWWHNEENKGIGYHRDLRRAFEREDKRILQFYHDEVDNSPEIIKSIVENLLGCSRKKVGARKCDIVCVSPDEANIFLQKNHLIGPVNASKFIGLMSGGELVTVLAYKKYKEYIDIVRFASQIGSVVSGGLRRLLVDIRKNNPQTLIKTLVDLRYANGVSLEKIGFRKAKEYLQYQYSNKKIRKDKRFFRVPAGVDERAQAAKSGWFRIYDAGKAVFEWSV